jgi:hypothetical protein
MCIAGTLEEKEENSCGSWRNYLPLKRLKLNKKVFK